MHEFEFDYDGQAVGYFEDRLPATSGRYRYMPYRGTGHDELGMALRAGKTPRCTMTHNPKISFIVFSCPEYGIYDISDIKNIIED